MLLVTVVRSRRSLESGPRRDPLFFIASRTLSLSRQGSMWLEPEQTGDGEEEFWWRKLR